MNLYPSLGAFLVSPPPLKGPIALVFAEDDVALGPTLTHLGERGFAMLLVFADDLVEMDGPAPSGTVRIGWDKARDAPFHEVVSTVIARAPGQWMHYCFNGEFLFYPFAETRTVAECCAFCLEERREAVLTYVIDLYAADLSRTPSGVCLETACLDRQGYYALARPDPNPPHYPLDRQLDFYGGLKWRFEQHVPPDRRRIDRISLFRAKPGLTLREDHTLSEPEMNTFACPWHNSVTAALCSFRTSKALRANAGSRRDVTTFVWPNSVRFEWSSEQLMKLGLIEPGQWF